MNIKNPLVIGITAITLLVLIFGWAAAQSETPQAPDVMQGAGFTYQGQLDRSGAPFTGACSFQFSLWDALSGGVRWGSVQTISSLSVNQGRFTALLNQGNEFGALPFTGEARWLQVAVQCPGDAAFTTLSPRQALTGAPFALSLIHGSRILPAGNGFGLHVSNNPVTSGIANPIAISASVNETDFLPGAVGYEDVPVAVRGVVSGGYGVMGITSFSQADSEFGAGVYGFSDYAYYPAVLAVNSIGTALEAVGEDPSRLVGGVEVFGSSFVDSDAPCCNGATLYSRNYGSGIGLRGTALGTNAGVFGQGGGSGVVGEATANGGIGVVGRLGAGVTSGLAGQFLGNVDVTGSVLAPVTSMRIDHPLNPADMYLNQAYIASPEMVNQYSGNAVTDASGFAVVRLPDYVQAINSDFRYNLTVIGQFAQAIIASELQGGSFTIQTDLPNVKVSWQVTGVRVDAYAAHYPLTVEESKPEALRGVYQNPELYGAGPEEALGYAFRQMQLDAPELVGDLSGGPR